MKWQHLHKVWKICFQFVELPFSPKILVVSHIKSQDTLEKKEIHICPNIVVNTCKSLEIFAQENSIRSECKNIIPASNKTDVNFPITKHVYNLSFPANNVKYSVNK